MLFSVATYCLALGARLANFPLFTFCELATYEPIMDETASFKVSKVAHAHEIINLFCSIFSFRIFPPFLFLFCVAEPVNVCIDQLIIQNVNKPQKGRENSKSRFLSQFLLLEKKS